MLAFWLTCLIELPWWIVGVRLARATVPDPPPATARLRRPQATCVITALLLTLGLNLLTHPIVWRLTADRELTTWIIAEIGAVLVEAVVAGAVLRWLRVARPWVDAALIALGANATSALVGVLFC